MQVQGVFQEAGLPKTQVSLLVAEGTWAFSVLQSVNSESVSVAAYSVNRRAGRFSFHKSVSVQGFPCVCEEIKTLHVYVILDLQLCWEMYRTTTVSSQILLSLQHYKSRIIHMVSVWTIRILFGKRSDVTVVDISIYLLIQFFFFCRPNESCLHSASGSCLNPLLIHMPFQFYKWCSIPTCS